MDLNSNTNHCLIGNLCLFSFGGDGVDRCKTKASQNDNNAYSNYRVLKASIP